MMPGTATSCMFIERNHPLGRSSVNGATSEGRSRPGSNSSKVSGSGTTLPGTYALVEILLATKGCPGSDPNSGRWGGRSKVVGQDGEAEDHGADLVLLIGRDRVASDTCWRRHSKPRSRWRFPEQSPRQTGWVIPLLNCAMKSVKFGSDG
jgi:hypothetical protein